MKYLLILGALAGGASFFPLSSARAVQSTACQASPVQYKTVKHAPSGVAGPWVASTNSAFRGYLFYFGGTRWARTRPHQMRIFTRAAHVKVHPKILWIALGRSASTMAIRGTRLDAPGSFASTYPAATGGGQFPSYVVVPAAGCWQVTVRSGSLHGSVTFLASDTA